MTTISARVDVIVMIVVVMDILRRPIIIICAIMVRRSSRTGRDWMDVEEEKLFWIDGTANRPQPQSLN
jgi:hypothetical protein